jgi:hypothetical protein
MKQSPHITRLNSVGSQSRFGQIRALGEEKQIFWRSWVWRSTCRACRFGWHRDYPVEESVVTFKRHKGCDRKPLLQPVESSPCRKSVLHACPKQPRPQHRLGVLHSSVDLPSISAEDGILKTPFSKFGFSQIQTTSIMLTS